MSIRDAETKRYISRPEIFADAFNFLLYNGEQVIQPETLRSVDTTEIIAPYGNGAKAPLQKYRDAMKIWAAMQDGEAVYVLLGCENQSKVHYAMPVRDMLYDSINYAAQVDSARQSYKNFKFDENGVEIKLTSEEFLSGFCKGDKLIPVITAVVLFNPDEWDAPMSIHELLNVNKKLLPFIPNYRINLIAPARINDSDFSSHEHKGKFNTGFGTLMQVIKHQNEIGVYDIWRDAPNLDVASAELIAEIANMPIEIIPDEKGEFNMCKGIELYMIKAKAETLIEAFRDMGMPDEEIAERVSRKLNVTIEYVKELMMPKAV